MAPKWRYLSLALIFILPLGVTLLSKDVATAPNSVELVCQIDQVTTSLQNNNIVIPVYMTNIYDSVSGFELMVSSSVPEFIRFAVLSNSGGVIKAKFDTVGTRCRGFKFFQTRILDTLHGLMKVSALCDPDSPRVVKPIPPGSGVLLKLILETNGALGDTLCAYPPINVAINRAETRFSNSASPPEVIGCNYVLHIDTVYTNCAAYIGDSCISWYDTTFVDRWRCVIDTTKRVLLDGKVSLQCCTCGDANGDAGIDISDAVFLIQYIFAGGAAPGNCQGHPQGLGDANGDGGIDVSDVVYLIQYIFAGGPAPHCPGL
jgi:hypothetical protein